MGSDEPNGGDEVENAGGVHNFYKEAKLPYLRRIVENQEELDYLLKQKSTAIKAVKARAGQKPSCRNGKGARNRHVSTGMMQKRGGTP